MVTAKVVGDTLYTNRLGKSVDALKMRLQTSKIPVASSFNNATVTAKTVGDTLYTNRLAIQTWMQSSPSYKDALVLRYTGSTNIGYGVVRGSDTLIQMNSAVVVLKPTNNPMGYKVITAYPKLPK